MCEWGLNAQLGGLSCPECSFHVAGLGVGRAWPRPVGRSTSNRQQSGPLPGSPTLCRSCCMCGVSILPNPANMCVNCIKGQVDITEGIQKQVNVLWCKGCGRYLQPPKHWMHAEPESKELLTYCIKRVRGLNKVNRGRSGVEAQGAWRGAAGAGDSRKLRAAHGRAALQSTGGMRHPFTQVKLVDASFIWTEPHSMRLKVKLTIQAEVLNGAILQQVSEKQGGFLHWGCTGAWFPFSPSTALARPGARPGLGRVNSAYMRGPCPQPTPPPRPPAGVCGGLCGGTAHVHGMQQAKRQSQLLGRLCSGARFAEE